jgi:hypothetical protein
MKDYSNKTCRFKWLQKSITFLDYRRIINCIQNDLGNISVSPGILHYLYLLVSVSKKYNSDKIPEYIVTMNSDVILQFENNQQQKIRIVYPGDIININDKSIYTSLGAACLGAYENSAVYFNDEYGNNKAYIKQIAFQPEKEKLFQL